MISITSKQHSRILGIALIAYGLQFCIKAFDVPKLLFGEEPIFSRFDTHLYYYFILPFDPLFLPFWYFLSAVFSGIIILRTEKNAKYLSILFVLLALTVFPLGTILSFYTLCYLFVISED